MYSESDIDRAFNDAREFPELSLQEWKDTRLVSKVPLQDIVTVGDRWKSYPCLLQYRKLDATIRKAIGDCITKHGLDDTLSAIDHYAEILSSDYFLNYKWDIKKFLKQSNAAPDFMDNGSKWANYLRDSKDKFYSWGLLPETHPKRVMLLSQVDKLMAQYKESVYASIPVNRIVSSGAELNAARELSYKGLYNNTYPTVFAHVAKELKVFSIEPITIKDFIFQIKFETITVFNSAGGIKSSYQYEKAFNELGL